MAKEQNRVTPANMRDVGIQQHPHHPMPPSRTFRIFRNILIGVGIALVLIIIECAVLFLNPFHVLGGGTPASISSLLSVLARTPLLLIVPLLTLIAVCVVVQVVDRPLALLAYLRAVQREQERYAKTYIPISADPNSDNL